MMNVTEGRGSTVFSPVRSKEGAKVRRSTYGDVGPRSSRSENERRVWFVRTSLGRYRHSRTRRHGSSSGPRELGIGSVS